MSLKDKLDKCFKEGREGGERHKGLRKIEPSQKLIDQHLKKAIHNFSAISDCQKPQVKDLWHVNATAMWFLSMLRIPYSFSPLQPHVKNVWNSDI
ncbi:hypothetical protein A3K73_03165 [Candidatus Pacearchaeota archaeon RBG_13_36_9]|nr:MAG: hypothetical protein A3K73_03165 [Candidatus Pacearchaeota archaeon RBG_13_36_9]